MKDDVILELLFPKRCPLCDKPVSKVHERNGFCESCYRKLPIINGFRCYTCGRKLSQNDKELCFDCAKANRKRYFEKGFSLCEYTDIIRSSVYRLKYSNRAEYAKAYGRLMAMQFGKAFCRVKADGVIAVPLHPLREQKRGYNQADLLAKAFSEYTKIPYYKNYVVRTENTKPLKAMTAFERQNNLKNAFKISQNDVKLNIIIVIDDIYTTGSTIDAVSRVLKAAGVKKIFFLTLAIGEDQ